MPRRSPSTGSATGGCSRTLPGRRPSCANSGPPWPDSARFVAVCPRCDDRGMTVTPVSLSQVLATFSDVYSPRIIGRVNDYDIRIAHVRGEHVWHVHDHTDEFFLVLDGQFDVAVREGGRGRTWGLRPGGILLVPRCAAEH